MADITPQKSANLRAVGQGVISAAFWSAVTSRPFTLSGDGSQIRDFLHVDDLVAATLGSIDCPIDLPSIVNVGSVVGYSVTECWHG
jgi:nucleoside-diphosphate-sugar epimerase